MAGRFVGYVERVDASGALEGWVIDLDRPTTPVHLRAWSGDRLVAEAVADIDRPDVHGAGFPARNCGFAAPVAEWARDGVERVLRFETQYGVEAPLSGMSSLCAPPVERAASPSRATDPRDGRFDYIRGGRVGGWSLDTATGDPVPVDVFCDGRHIGVFGCNGFRGDLFNTFGAQGGAFDAELPASIFDGLSHEISVRADGRDLAESPRFLTPDEQRLHLCLAALHTNSASAGAIGPGFVADALLDRVTTPRAELSPESKTLAAVLPADLLADVEFTGGANAAREIANRILASDGAPVQGSAGWEVLVRLCEDRTFGERIRDRLAVDGGDPRHRLIHGVAASYAGDFVGGLDDMFQAAHAGGEVVARQASAVLLASGRTADAARALQLCVDAWAA